MTVVTVLRDLGWVATDAQLHTVPVYLVALVFLFLGAWASDRLKHRCAFIVLPVVVAMAGYGMLLGQANLSPGAKYAAVFLAIFGGYASPNALSWLMNNLVGHNRRGIGAGIANGVGNLSGLLVSNVFFGTSKRALPCPCRKVGGASQVGADTHMMIVRSS